MTAVVEVVQQRSSRWADRLRSARAQLGNQRGLVVEGVLSRMVGLAMEATGVEAPVGTLFLVETADGQRAEAEVVGFTDDRLFLMPTGDPRGLSPGARVAPATHDLEVGVGRSMLGRVIDGAGRPLDGLGRIEHDARVPLGGRPINPLARRLIREPLDVGVRSINGLFTIGRGQRIGLMAGSGVGKSVLLGMMTRFTTADVVVVGLIGERGREVAEFVTEILGPEGLRRAVVVAAPADHPPLMRMHAAWRATALAEYFRDQGLEVLLLMDSLTRFAQAQREIALAVGEPPVTKGYPPSVFARLPHLVERAGNGGEGGGSITAFYTVLVEGDDQSDPVADASRAILDGHLVLSRAIAESGIYPALDLEASISRVMQQVINTEQWRDAQRLRRLYSLYQQNRDLIAVGAYKRGTDARIDTAIAAWPQILRYMEQNMQEKVSLEKSRTELVELLATVPELGHG
ncbi:MAG TPA: flagellar protein export ATPase FliI [Steroidobacteraceae bacterium]|nr:flagellar protein export ATPase FliI [Steroidobacteraceae bacterium]